MNQDLLKKLSRISAISLAAILLMSSFIEESNQVTNRIDSTKVKIAMAQIFCLDGDKAGNLVRIENAIIEAKERQADIVVFPEASLLGWVNPDAHFRASPIPGNDSKHLCDLAEKYGVFICIGLIEKEDDKIFDSVILIDDSGNILLKHRKINILSSLMDPPYSPGNDVNVVETKYGTIGLLICADSFIDDLLIKMKAKKPDLLLIPYGWAAPEQAWPDHGEELVKVVLNTSKVVDCPVVGTNLVGEISHGPWTGQTYGGLSVAYDNNIDTLIVGRDRERDIHLVVIDLKLQD